jgi:hypothetical protein
MSDTPNGQEELDETTNVEVTATEKPAEEVEVPQEEVVEDQLPDGVAERTREQFEKLKLHNKQLAEKVAQYEKPAQPRRSALDAFEPSPQVTGNLSPAQVDEIKQNFVDPEGYVNVDAVNNALAESNRLAKEAIQSARKAEEKVAKYEHTDETRKTYKEHPYLDPYSPVYDEKFSELTRREILTMMYEEGTQDYLEAANRVKQRFYDPVAKQAEIRSQEQTKVQQTQVARTQANAMSGGNKGNFDATEHARLVEGTMKGDRDSIAERLKRSGY